MVEIPSFADNLYYVARVVYIIDITRVFLPKHNPVTALSSVLTHAKSLKLTDY